SPLRVGGTGHRGAETIAVAIARQRQDRGAGPARVDIGASRAAACAWRADDDVGAAVAIDVADAGGVQPERVVCALAAHGEEDAAVAPRIHAGVASGGRARDDVGNAVGVGVASPFDAGTELVAGREAVGRPEARAGPRRVHVDPARARGRGWRGRDDVGHAVAVHVADAARDPAELIVGGLAVPLAQ